MEYVIRKARESDSSKIARTLAYSFEKGLSPLTKDMERIARVFENGIATDCFYIAEQDDEMIGAAAFSDFTGRALKSTKSECKEHLGFIRGSLAYRILCSELMRPHSYPENTAYIDVVGVLEKARGKGVAKEMLRAIIKNNSKYDEFILEADSVNSSAIKCYTDLGFVEFKRVPIIKFFKRSRVYMKYKVLT